MIPHNISDNSLFFFAHGRPFQVAKDNPNFDAIRSGLLSDDADIDTLIEWADVRSHLRNAGLVIDGDVVAYNGVELHNAWVDKILSFHALGLPSEPVFKALADLMTNPEPQAIERLPIFVERSGLGFLPDGRIAAYKGVRADFHDVHSGRVLYAIGTTVQMPREDCNPDPERTCTSGLHVGALDYVRNQGYGWGSDRRLLMVAFWPRDVVAVPRDYGGGKMRVCSLDVIEEVDRNFVDAHFGFNRTLVGYEAPTPVREATPAECAEVGDYILLGEGSFIDPGVYKVIEINEHHSQCRVCIRHPLRPSDSSGIYGVYNDNVLAVAEDCLAFQTQVGDVVEVKDDGDLYVDDGYYKVVAIHDDRLDDRILIEMDGNSYSVTNESIVQTLRRAS